MGTFNYGTSDYITLAYNFDSFRGEEEDLRDFEIESMYSDAEKVLENFTFEFFKVSLLPGYYEGFYLSIESVYIWYDDIQEKRAAQKEVTQLKQLLFTLAGIGLVSCTPGWCTGYRDAHGTKADIKKAVRAMRNEIKNACTARTRRKKGCRA